MSGPQTKRKVMGRVELGQDRPGVKAATPAPRLSGGAARPVATSTRVPSSSRPVAGVARARVNMSNIAGPSSGVSSPGVAKVQAAPGAATSAYHTTTQTPNHANASVQQGGFNVPSGNYTFSSPSVMRSPLTETTATYTSPSLSAQTRSPPPGASVGHDDAANLPPAKVRASVNGFARQAEPHREPGPAKVRVASAGSSGGYFNIETADARPAVRKQASFGSTGAKLRNRTSLVLADSPQASPGGAPLPGGPSSPSFATHRLSSVEQRPSHASRPSIGGSSAISNSSAGPISPNLASSAAMQNIVRRPSITPHSTTSAQMQTITGSLSPPRKQADLAHRARLSGVTADESNVSTPDRMQLWDAAPISDTPRDATFLTTSTSAGSGIHLLSPTQELGQEELDAKVNRKILDLEISNKSLLAINSGLEVIKHKQAREIRELKRRLREGLGLGNIGASGEHPVHDAGLYLDSDGEEDGDDLVGALDADAPLQAELEASHARCKAMIDDMVQRARDAILAPRPELPQQSSGSRVLHPAELDGMMDSSSSKEDETYTHIGRRHRQASQGARASGDFGASSSSSSSSEAGHGPSATASMEDSSPVTPTSSGIGYEHNSLDHKLLAANTARLSLTQDTPRAT